MSTSDLNVTLQGYLHAVFLPVFRAKNVPFLREDGRAWPWPEYKELVRPSGTRQLRVIRLDLAQLRWNTNAYFAEVPDVQLEYAEIESLLLPDGKLRKLSEPDWKYLTLVGTKLNFLYLVQYVLLDTLSAALRLIHRIPEGVPLGNALDFQETPQFCSVWRSKWSVLYLPGSIPGMFEIAVVSLSPWEFGFADFDEFVHPKKFPEGQLDRDVSHGQASCKLWAALHDVCVGRGYYFVVTTYDRWAIGRFSDNWTEVEVTQTIKGPLRKSDGSMLYPNEEDAPNVMEMVLYWIQVARGAAIAKDLRGKRQIRF